MILDTLTKLTEYFGSEQLLVDAERCLNARFKKADCHICVEACPVEAITLSGRQMRLDPDQCAHCGACVWQCPTEVFTQPRPSASKLTQTLLAIRDEAVDLRCPQNTTNTTAVHNATIVLYPRCLANLPASTLIELASQRSIYLNDEKCAQCPLSKAHSSIVDSVDNANHWMDAFGKPQQIFLLSSTKGSQLDQLHPARMLDSANPPTDRRGFFSSLKRALAEAGVTAIDGLKNNDDSLIAAHQRLPQRLPRERQDLVAALGKLGQPRDDAPMNLPRVQIQAKQCTACGLCAKFCPSGALRFHANGDRFDLDFAPLACIDCDLCAMACPSHAVTVYHDTGLGRFIRPAASLLIEGDLVPCAVCKKPTAAQAAQEPRCEVCQSHPDKQALSKDWFDSLYPPRGHQS